MKTTLKKIGVVVAVVALLAVIFVQFFLPRLLGRFVTTEVLYAAYPLETMLAESDLIFVGRVTEVGPTRWNQNNGEFWIEGMPYHTIEFAEVQTLAGSVDEPVILTVVGNNPRDRDEETFIESEHTIAGGEEMVVFARHTQFAWRDPELVPATMLMSSPNSSFFIKDEEGLYHASRYGEAYPLDELRQMIAAARSAPSADN